MGENESGVKALLEFVGWPLTHLRLGLSLSLDIVGYFDDSDLHNIWECCPNLVTLGINSLSIGSFDTDAYATGKCRASSLNLTKCEVHDQRSVFSFIQALEDAELAITQTLRRLELHIGRSDPGDVTDELLEAFLAMLQVNRHLRTLLVFTTTEQQVRFEPRVRTLNGPIYKPLRMSGKTAFSSVVKRAQERETRVTRPQAIAKLDSRIISHIFALSGEKFSRMVMLIK